MTPEAEAFRAALKAAVMPIMPEHGFSFEDSHVFMHAVRLFDEHLAPLRSLLDTLEHEREAVRRAILDSTGSLSTAGLGPQIVDAIQGLRSLLGVREEEIARLQDVLLRYDEGKNAALNFAAERNTDLVMERDSAREELAKLKSAVNSVMHCRDGAGCDSYAHEDDCPAADGANAVLRLGEMLAAKAREIQEYEAGAGKLKDLWAHEAGILRARIAELEKALAEKTTECAVWERGANAVQTTNSHCQALEARLKLAGELGEAAHDHLRRYWGNNFAPPLAKALSAWDAGKVEEPEPCPTGACSPAAKNCTHEPEPADRYAWFRGRAAADLVRWIYSPEGKAALGVEEPKSTPPDHTYRQGYAAPGYLDYCCFENCGRPKREHAELSDDPNLPLGQVDVEKWNAARKVPPPASPVVETSEALADAPPDEVTLGTEHGSARRWCECPGCKTSIPACWATPACRPCANEDCDHEDPAPGPHVVEVSGPADRAQRIADLEKFVRDVRDNWDCDDDAHRYGTRCRCCEAEKLLPKPAGPDHPEGR